MRNQLPALKSVQIVQKAIVLKEKAPNFLIFFKAESEKVIVSPDQHVSCNVVSVQISHLLFLRGVCHHACLLFIAMLQRTMGHMETYLVHSNNEKEYQTVISDVKNKICLTRFLQLKTIR